jgi:hypothetical protein
MIRKTFLKKDNTIYNVIDGTLNDTGLEEPLTEEDYLEHGMDDLGNVPFNELGHIFEVLTYADFEGEQSIKLSIPESTPLDWLDDPNPVLVTYSEGSEPPTLYVTLEVEQKVEFWVSKDEHQTHWVFRDGAWQESDIGMSKEEIEAITPAQWALWFERGTLDFKIRLSGLRVPGETEGPWVESITVTFPENEAPLIKNFLLTPDEFHNEYVELSATIEDQEGDPVYYQVLINGERVYPADDEWSPPLESGTEIFLAYNHPYFNVGTNTVTLRVKDDRGKEREQSGEVILLNNPPTITLTHTNFNLHATLGDEDGDDVSYRLLINGKQFYPEGEGFSEPISAPAAIVIPWGSQDLILGEENTLRLEVKDAIGEVTSTEFTVVGHYQGLMFVDEEGNYFTTDQGVILQELDFGPLVAGRTSPVRKLILRNQLGEPVENPEITISHDVLDVAINISSQEEPFVPKDHLNPPAMGDGDTYEFYVRVYLNKNATTGGSFRINSNTME